MEQGDIVIILILYQLNKSVLIQSIFLYNLISFNVPMQKSFKFRYRIKPPCTHLISIDLYNHHTELVSHVIFIARIDDNCIARASGKRLGQSSMQQLQNSSFRINFIAKIYHSIEMAFLQPLPSPYCPQHTVSFVQGDSSDDGVGVARG